MPHAVPNPETGQAMDAIATLRTSYAAGLTSGGRISPAIQNECLAKRDAALKAVTDPALVKRVDDAVAALSKERGTDPQIGLDLLGKIDVTKIDDEDLEAHLSKLLGYDRKEFKKHVEDARSGLKYIRREGRVHRVHDAAALVMLLDHAYDLYDTERNARKKRFRTRKDAKRSYSGHRTRVDDAINGSLYAAGIIIANSDYASVEFARSYFLGSGVSYRHA